VTRDLKAKWSAIESWAIGVIQELAGGGSFGLTRCAPSFHLDENKITAEIEGVAPNTTDGGSAVIQNTLEVVNQTVEGFEFVPVQDGDPEANLVFQGSRVPIETVTRRWKELASTPKKAAGASAPVGNDAQIGASGAPIVPVAPIAAPLAIPAAAGGARWFIISTTSGTRPLAIGVGGKVVSLEERWTTRVRRRATAV
jgi:hypothetical protein